MQLSELLTALQQEYPPHPSPQDLRYSDEYAVIEAEQQKLTSLYGEKPDYPLMIQNALILVQQGSQYAFVITALSFAMLQQYAWPGFLEGVRFASGHLNPKGEQFANWLVERYQRYLDTHPITGLGKDFIEKMLAALKDWELDSVITLIRPFEDQLKRMNLEEGARARQAQLDEEKKLRDAKAALNPSEVIEESISTEIRKDAYLDFIKQNPLEFSAYKYSRAEMWWRLPLSVQELLNVLEDHGLEWEAYAAAFKLKAEQKHEEALIAFETLAHSHPYFLELQWHICDCLEELKADEPLLAMLKNEVRELCAKYPELDGANINNSVAICSKHAKRYFGVFQFESLT